MADTILRYIRKAKKIQEKREEKALVFNLKTIPQAAQGKAVSNVTVLVHPWTASMKDSSRETYHDRQKMKC